MSSPVADVTFVPAGQEERARGLLGFVSMRFGDDLVLDGVTLRRTEQGRLALSYPMRRDRRGRTHHFIRPADDDARRRLERAVIDALRRGGAL